VLHKKDSSLQRSIVRYVAPIVVILLAFAPLGCNRYVMSDVESKLANRSLQKDERAEYELPKPLDASLDPEVTDRVKIKTNMGTMVVGLYGKEVPKTVANFLSYVDSGFYEGKVFHRIIPGFVIQGGGFDKELVKAPTNAPIDLELIPGLEHTPGVISMARTNDPHSATSQFFICVGNADQLNGAYSAFGKLESGMDIANNISLLESHSAITERGQMQDVPKKSVIIESVTKL